MSIVSDGINLGNDVTRFLGALFEWFDLFLRLRNINKIFIIASVGTSRRINNLIVQNIFND